MRRFSVYFVLMAALLLSACTPLQVRATSTIPFLQPTRTRAVGSPSPTANAHDSPATNSDAPGGTPQAGDPYPGPQAGNSYPPPQTTPLPTNPNLPSQTATLPVTTATGSPPTLTPTRLPSAGLTSTVSPSGTLTATATITTTPVVRYPEPAGPPPAQLISTITIWHSWDETEVDALWNVIGSYQETNPNIGFDLVYVPPDELQAKFASAAYLGGGPSILLAPAEWGPGFADSGLLVDFTPYVNPDFLAALNPAALGTGRYKGALISLPYALRGVLLYRNQAIINQPAVTFNQMIALCQAINRVGAVGAAIDRGIYFSGAHLNGLGGSLMDENGNPAFNNDTGLEWINLLRSFDQLGITTFNSNRDRQLFEQGKAGWIVETSGNLRALARAIGSDNLAIDPWPSDGEGHLSGYVLADSVYLNANLSGDDLKAALAFTGYYLAPEVQRLLAEVDHIPSGLNVPVRDRLIQQAETAFADGTTFPINPEAQVYWSVLDSALTDIFSRGIDPATALQQAADTISARLAALQK